MAPVEDDYKPKILVVDDQPDNLVAMEKLLRKVPAETVTANGGKEALSLVLNNKFAAILLDVQMPEMDGYEVGELIRGHKNTSNIPIIFVTANHKSKEFISRGYKAGAVDYLCKPVDSEILLSKVGVFLDLHLEQHENFKLINLLTETQERLEHSSRVKDDFMAAMSHEMRTPLNAIINFSNHLNLGVYGPIDSSHQEIIERITRAGSHLSALVEGVLTTMSFQRDSLELEMKAFDLSKEVFFSMELIKPATEEKQLTLNANVPDSIQIFGDQCRIRQVLLNILGNAVKFTKQGSIAVTTQVADDEIFISVSDTGIGIPAESIQDVLEPFAQVQTSLSRQYGGLGLGLSISNKLINMHNGRLILESSPGKGTVVTICLPKGDCL